MAGDNGDRTRSALTVAATVALLALTLLAVVPVGPSPAWPTLALLAAAWAAVLIVSLVRRTPAAPPGAVTAPSPPVRDTTPDAIASVELLAFASELYGELHGDRLRDLIARQLPQLLGLRDVWVVARFGPRRVVITPSGTDRASASPILTGEAAEWATFPMNVDRTTVGVLGIGLPAERFTRRDRQLLSRVAAIVGRALKTSDTYEAMRETSIVDPLTGCLLRPEGMRRLDAELRRAQRFSRPVALLLLDLDLFKSVNDRFGHACGDAVLTAVGGLMTRTLRASDLRCRWGGEEFLIVLPESPLENAKRVAESLRERIADLGVRCGHQVATTTASLGVVIAQPGELDAQRLVSLADKALYQAKHAGRNCVRVLNEDPPVRPPEEADRRAAPSPAKAEPAERSGWPGVDRRNPSKSDRRLVPSPGRRRTDPGFLSGPWIPLS